MRKTKTKTKAELKDEVVSLKLQAYEFLGQKIETQKKLSEEMEATHQLQCTSFIASNILTSSVGLCCSDTYDERVRWLEIKLNCAKIILDYPLHHPERGE